MSKLDLTKPLQTRDGRSVRVVATDMYGIQPIVAIITDEYGDEDVETFTQDGHFFHDLSYSDSDLVNVPEDEVDGDRKYVLVRVNQWNEYSTCLRVFGTKAEADDFLVDWQAAFPESHSFGIYAISKV